MTYLERRGRLADLIKACRSERPNVAWHLSLPVLENKPEGHVADVGEDEEGWQSPLALLEMMVEDCRAKGFSGVCVLVDNVDLPQDGETTSGFQRILKLIRYPDLLSTDGVIFKFLLPAELNEGDRRKLPTTKYPLYPVIWNRQKLRGVLARRLGECLASSVRGPQSSPDLQGLVHLNELCAGEWGEAVEDVFVEFGLWAGQPRAMWQLGHYLIMEHFSPSRRHSGDLIKLRSLLDALERLEREVQLPLDSGPYDVRSRIRACLESPARNRARFADHALHKEVC